MRAAICPHTNSKLDRNLVAIVIPIPIVIVPVVVAVPIAVVTPLMAIRVVPAMGVGVATVPHRIQFSPCILRLPAMSSMLTHFLTIVLLGSLSSALAFRPGIVIIGVGFGCGGKYQRAAQCECGKCIT